FPLRPKSIPTCDPKHFRSDPKAFPRATQSISAQTPKHSHVRPKAFPLRLNAFPPCDRCVWKCVESQDENALSRRAEMLWSQGGNALVAGRKCSGSERKCFGRRAEMLWV